MFLLNTTTNIIRFFTFQLRYLVGSKNLNTITLPVLCGLTFTQKCVLCSQNSLFYKNLPNNNGRETVGRVIVLRFFTSNQILQLESEKPNNICRKHPK